MSTQDPEWTCWLQARPVVVWEHTSLALRSPRIEVKRSYCGCDCSFEVVCGVEKTFELATTGLFW